MLEERYGEVYLKVFKTREEMGIVAAKEAAKIMEALLIHKDEINCVFAAAPSQLDFLGNLTSNESIQWNKINAFNMDDYIGFGADDSRSFASFLNKNLLEKVACKSVNLLNGLSEPERECKRYSELLSKNPIDIVFMGIGENGHIAFNDPSVADFQDPELVKIVELEESCRIQQVNDGCFPTIEDVPKKAITLTIPALTSGDHIFCMVPTINKADAVAKALKGDINEACPASILRTVKNVNMYIDEGSASKL